MSNSEIYQQVKTGVNNKTDQMGKMLLKMSENESRVDLDKYLQATAPEQKEEERKSHFVINDEDEDGEIIPIEKKEEPAPEKPMIMKVEEKPEEVETPETESQKVLKKGNSIEVEDLDKLGLNWVGTRKEVKNLSMIRNFVTSFEDRKVAIVPLGGDDKLHLVVLKLQTYQAEKAAG